MNPYKILLPIIGYFFATAVLGSVVGSYIDTKFGIQPKGTLLVLFVFYVISWLGAYTFLKWKKYI